uniref:GBF-interacting protein 1 N-terminal domain-containing protein n=3 Tax=Rhizophora mucronata TaxID=61149 RepID=A0A2P2M5P2_RHIMU
MSGIPVGSRKIVQSLKEIVNCPEAEIYAMLKECSMDPNEAVNRLLSQDPFHEVKSKREKKKENKDTMDPRFHGATDTIHRGGRGVADRYGRGGSSQISPSDYGASHGKPAYRKENGTHAYAGSLSSASSIPGSNINQQPSLPSNSVSTENRIPTISAVNGVSSSLQPFSGYQSAWIGVPGQVSMADIVKMGRPHNKASAMPSHHSVNSQHAGAPPFVASCHDLQFSDNHAPKVTGISTVPEVAASHNVHSEDEWPTIEHQQAASLSSVLEVPADSELYGEPSKLHLNKGNKHIRSELDDAQSADDGHVEALNGHHVAPASLSSRDMHDDGSRGSSLFDNNLYGDVSPYQSHGHAFEHNKGGCDA